MPRFTVERQNNNNNSSWWTGEKQATTRNLVVKIPPISEGVKAVIASKLTKKQPWLLQKANLDQAQHRAQVAHEKLKHAKKNLEQLQQGRDQALADVKEVRGKQLQVLLKETEEQIRKESQQEIDNKEQECKIICEGMEAKMIALLKEREIEHEEFLKRSLDKQEAEKEEPPTKRFRLDDGEEVSKAESSEYLPPEELMKYSVTLEQRKQDVEVSAVFKFTTVNLRVTLKLTLYVLSQVAKEKVEKLEETKKEMVWLLKQVIKAEAKETLMKLKLAKTNASAADTPSEEAAKEETIPTINPVD